MPRSPLAIVADAIEFYKLSIMSLEVLSDPKRLADCQSAIRALEVVQASMEIEYFLLGDRTTLQELRKGAVFATEDGVYAVKSEYRYDNEDQQWQCVLLASGEYAHFADGNATVVYELILPVEHKE